MQKPLWTELSTEEFNPLIKDIANDLDDKTYKTTINNHVYDLKNTEKILLEVITKKISEAKACELYDRLTKGDTDALEKGKGGGEGKNRRYNIFDTLRKVGLLFNGAYLHYNNAPKPESKPESKSKSEESIAERTKLRKQISDKIAEKEKKIKHELFKKHFKYLSPSDIRLTRL